MDGTDVEIEEYEEIVGNWDQASVREGATDIRAVSIQEPTSNELFDSMAHIERPALRPTEESFAGEGNDSHTVVVKLCGSLLVLQSLFLFLLLLLFFNPRYLFPREV